MKSSAVAVLHEAWDHCRSWMMTKGARVLGLPVLMLAPIMVGCESQSLRPDPIPDDRQLYWDLVLSHHAVTLSTTAPYDTLQLTAVPRNYLGEPLAALPDAVYRSTDIERVVVTEEGLVVAVAPTIQSQPVWVYATMTAGNLKHEDSVAVKVVANATPPVLSSLSIHPVPPDTAKVAVEVRDFLPVQVLDTAGAVIPDIPTYINFSDTTIIKFHSSGAVNFNPLRGNNTAIVAGVRSGTATLYATTTVFGVTKTDTLPYRVGRRVMANVRVLNPAASTQGTFPAPQHPLVGPWGFLNSEVYIGTGGTVAWGFNGSSPGDMLEAVDVTFAEADLLNVTATNPFTPWLQVTGLGLLGAAPMPLLCSVFNVVDCGNGNASFGGGIMTDIVQNPTPPPFRLLALRTFPVPGVYEFTSTTHNSRGRVVVVDEQ